MIRHLDIEKFSVQNPVVTIGFFDGVHMGHKYILDELMNAAKKIQGETVLLSFWPHPRAILKQEDADFKLLNSMEEKVSMLEDAGLDHLLVIPFTRDFSQLSADDFVKEILVGKMGISHLMVGFNQTLGRDRQGDYAKLKVLAEENGFGIEQLSSFALKNGNISSSRIRAFLKEGNVEKAKQLLGREYSFSGKVITGSKLGTSIGFPTANIIPDEEYKIIPADGVYAVRVQLAGKYWQGMMNIGTRPTVNQDPEKKTIEVHLLNFNNNIYNEPIRVQFVSRLRDEQKFSNIDSLKKQLLTDQENTMEIFKNNPKEYSR